MPPSGHNSFTWAPFRVAPKFVERVWGYRDLRPWFDFAATGQPVGEVWLTGDQCQAQTGPHTGRTLGSLFEQSPAPLLGPHAPPDGSPLLIKVLFAQEKLSVQVHPDDRLARKYGQPRGKTECWYALAAEPQAEVAFGLKPGTTLDDVKTGIHAGTLESRLNLLPVAKNDMILVDAGTVHAIWPGSVLLEVQQNSDITYRLYDYGRPRELHIEKGLEATQVDARGGKVPPVELAGRNLLLDAAYFRIERVPLAGSIASEALSGSHPEPELSYLFAAEGTGRLSGDGFEPVELPSRSIVCVPAAAPQFAVQDLGGLDLIRIAPQWPAAA
jgi:mannose-6-phosphate isomerase